jgi:zinc/manganese transport system permease protein
MFEFMLRPFLECLILVGIHTYLGLHVIRRRVIFVDLALAQIAALGTIVGGILGLMDGTAAAMTYSLLFCLVGAAVFAFTRVRHDRIPQEAVIGLVYAITFALAILVVQKTEGVEHMEGILVGNLLFVKWSDILASLVAYALVGGFHLVFWKRFLLISDYPEKAFRQGMSVRLWDFLFYATFGFVITFSTRVAGVLLVFVFLVAPAILAVMITSRFSRQLLIGWGSGTLVTVIGLYLSAHPDIDLPSGPTVVTFYGVVLAVAAVVVYLVKSRDRQRALAHTGIGLIMVALIGVGLWGSGRLLAALQGASEPGLGQGRRPAAAQAPALEAHPPCPPGAAAGSAAGEQALGRGQGGTGRGLGPGGGMGRRRGRGLGPGGGRGRGMGPGMGMGRGRGYRHGQPQPAPAAVDLLPGEQLEAICSRVEQGDVDGLGELIAFVSDDETPEMYCAEALEVLRTKAGSDFGFSCEAEPAANREACARMRQWLKEEYAPAD